MAKKAKAAKRKAVTKKAATKKAATKKAVRGKAPQVRHVAMKRRAEKIAPLTVLDYLRVASKRLALRSRCHASARVSP